MSQFDIVDPGDPVLSMVAQEVSIPEFQTDYVRNIIDRMYEIAGGKGQENSDTRQILGLAAPQIGVSKRIIMIDLASTGMHDKQDLKIFINPRITYRSIETTPGREGCWSTGNICGNVERSKEVVLQAVELSGDAVEYRFTGFTARIAQHEIDHLDGIRFPDRIVDDARLHWVEHDEFDDYRVHWANWPRKCPRVVWDKLKSGK